MLGIAAILAGVWRIYQRLDAWNDAVRLARHNSDKIDSISDDVQAIRSMAVEVTAQVTTNGGSSLKDQVVALGEQMSEHARVGNERHQRVDVRLDAIEQHLGIED